MEPKDYKQLFAKAKAGDRRAFGELYEAFYVPVHKYVASRVKDRAAAEDLVQDVFLKVYRALGTIEPTSAPLAYFFTVARNAVIDHWRKAKPMAGDAEEILGMLPYEGASAADDFEARERSALAKRLLAGLAPEEREVVSLRFTDGLAAADVAKVVGKSPEAVRQIQSRALRKMRVASAGMRI
jgi:RNA polymerase sigma-70 factor (ECF subfamily)